MAFPIAARFVHPGNGYKGDQDLAAEHLTVGKVYTVTGIDVGRSTSRLFLDIPDGPQFGFNTVLFEPASIFDDEQPPAHPFTAECDGFHPTGEQCNLPAQPQPAPAMIEVSGSVVRVIGPAPELAAAMAETGKVADAANVVLDAFTRGSDGYRARLSGVTLMRAYKAIGRPVPDDLKHLEGQ